MGQGSKEQHRSLGGTIWKMHLGPLRIARGVLPLDSERKVAVVAWAIFEEIRLKASGRKRPRAGASAKD